MVLPVLISVPHGGSDIPPELRDRVCITGQDLFDDSDALTGEIYDVRDEVEHFHRANVARAIVDLNRSPDDLPPANPDGVVKTATCYDRPIWRPETPLIQEMAGPIISSYWEPYHAALERDSADPAVRVALDCHSMADHPPAVAPDAAPRPLFCLSNDNGSTAPLRMMTKLQSAIVGAFDCAPEDVKLNDPFKGGYITRSLGGGNSAWIQIEMNRKLYLADPWFDRAVLKVSEGRIEELRGLFLQALREFAADI